MRNLRILASDEEGTLQRTIFEFSRRNIPIGKLSYQKEKDTVTMHIGVERDEDADRVMNHLNRIYGVTDVRVLENEEVSVKW